jgi:hypothetical protein
MTPSGNKAERGVSGDIGECRIQDVAAAMVGLLGGVVSEYVVGASAFFGGSWKVWTA